MLPRTLAITFFAITLLAAEPEKLTKLRSGYESAMTKATAPIQKTYATELEKLKIEFTKAGDLEAALAVDAEIRAITAQKVGTTKGDKPPVAPAEHLLGDWISADNPKDIYTINADHTARHANSSGDWTIENGLLIITWGSKYRITIEVSQTGRNITINSFKPDSSVPASGKWTKKR